MSVTFIKGAFEKNCNFITSQIEHPAVLESCKQLYFYRGCNIITLSPDKDGVITLESLAKEEKKIKSLQPKFATIMLVNNETGMIQPIKELFKTLRKWCPNIICHTDAVQAVGKTSLDVQDLGVDSLSLSGHKFGAPKGIGILYVKNGVKLNPLINGGGQENGLRSGTENVPDIMGITKALEITEHNRILNHVKMVEFDEMFLTKMWNNFSNIQLNGSHYDRALGIFNICFKGISAQNLLLFLDFYNIFVSAGSACHSDSDEPSHVLTAMGVSKEDALASLRFSFKEPIDSKKIDYIIDKLKKGINLQKENG